MQEIFYNGKIMTNNEHGDIVDAMMINDGSVVFVGSNDEVLNLKTDDTKVIDLKNQNIYPSFFALKANVFDIIDDEIKNANTEKIFQNIEEINEDYDNFCNFDLYKEKYFEYEKLYLANGITTIVELNINKREFAFWKKMSDDNLLNLDVVVYVDIVSSKQIMDNNCVTYRKYRNHLRIGGYYFKIDGKVDKLKAWLTKPYAGTKNFVGAGECFGEQLYFLTKTALDEKKQIIFETNGDKAILEVLNIFDELAKKDGITNFYKPVFYGSNIIKKQMLEKIKKYDITLCFEYVNFETAKTIKKYLGFFRKTKYQNIKFLLNNNVRFVFVDSVNYIQNTIKMIRNVLIGKNLKRFIKNEKFKVFIESEIKKLVYNNQSFICFDQDTKGMLETQMQANFVVSKTSLFEEIINETGDNISEVYCFGEKKY